MSFPQWSVEAVLASRPLVRVNQVGYLPGRPIQATLVTDTKHPLSFTVRGRGGASVWSGRSAPWPTRPEPTSGLTVHVLDFTTAGVHGRDVRVELDGHLSHPFAVGTDAYGHLARDALGVFRLLRSGAPLRDDVPAGYARPAGHAGHPPNRGDTAVTAWTGPDAERLYPDWRCPGTFDVFGGWYDAGDYGKYVTSGSVAVWQLLSALDLLPTRPTAWSTGLAKTVREECRWQLDWLLRMQVPDGAPLAGMAFHRVHGTEWSPVPGWAHEDPTERVLHRPSTPATLQLAAAAAHGARHFGGTDPAYARRLLVAASTAYAAATRHPELGAPDDHARFGGGPYSDDDPTDDHYWAAAELWLVTGDETYLEDMHASPVHTADVFDLTGFDFDRVAGLARLDLALHGTSLPDHDDVRDGVTDAADRLLTLQAAQPWGQPYAPAEGWDWGSNGRILNNLVVLVVAHLLTGNRGYANGVAAGMDYLLGRNGLGQSYVTGYGTDYSRHQRTRQFGHDLDPAFPPPPSGALAGGPNSRPHSDFPYDERLVDLAPQLCYIDEPTSEVTNDICIRWNAPLVYVSSFLNVPR
jgi:endoglucanase